MASAKRIALFGGTFDPVHLGHLSMAQVARRELALDEVRFLPCRISPHKPDHPPASAAARVRMLELATEDLPWAEVDESETRRPGPSYSWQTAEEMQQRFPACQLFWIMGSDQWQVLETWEQPQRLADIVEFIVFSRGASPQPRPGCTLHPLTDVHPAKASQIREELAAGVDTHAWLDPKVAAWIAAEGLYPPTP